MINNDNQNNEKWKPYFKRENSIYKKHPFLAWAITIVVITGGLWLMYQGIEESKSNARYNAGYKSVYQK